MMSTVLLVLFVTTVVLLLLMYRRLRRVEGLTAFCPKTGLLNGMLLTSVDLPSAIRREKTVGLILIDLDKFGIVNKREGMLAADRLIVTAAAAIRGSVPRMSDLVYRLNTAGDEFCILQPGATDQVVRDTGRRLVRALAAAGCPGSIGMVLSESRAGVGAEQLLSAADRAMRDAKRAGGSCVSYNGEILSSTGSVQLCLTELAIAPAVSG